VLRELPVIGSAAREDAKDQDLILPRVVLESDAPLSGSEAVLVGPGKLADI
jgi:hypothetical protein